VITAAKILRAPRLESIRSKVLAFAVVATLLPTSVTLWISYAQNRAALETSISQDLRSQSAQTAREVGVWLREHLYDLRLFASSYEVSDNIDFGHYGIAPPTSGRLHDYLASLQHRFGEFSELAVLDFDGRVIATSGSSVKRFQLPADWLNRVETEQEVVGPTYWDTEANRGTIVLIVPVRRPGGQLIGALAAELGLASVQHVLRTFATRTDRVVALASLDRGALIATSREVSPRILQTAIHPGPLARLTARQGVAFRYSSDARYARERVVGALARVPDAKWVVVAETSADAAFAEVARFRNMALILMVAVLIIVAAAAYRLGIVIARPLDHLMRGAARVARGELDVDLPVAGAGEVGQLTSAFNHMVWRLREGRRQLDTTNEMLRKQNAELERLSLTDGLTGLANHRLLMQRLEEETHRFHRHGRPFSVLVADVDNFKAYNDQFGHPAGDDVLRHVGTFLRAVTRGTDCVARNGGDEFCILLAETPADEVARLAERIRERLKTARFPGAQITLSLGAASLPADGVTPDSVLGAADDAMYRAKREGRDRFVQADGLVVGRHEGT
jgi:diguanylate cyclase (GGDEF)-like protein